ncbi:MAG: tetratricopeptide repeat protein [Calditrichia bacterium]
MSKWSKLMVLVMILLSVSVFAQDELSNDVKKLYNEGNLALKSRDYDLALEKYKAAVALDANFAKGHYWAGVANKMKKNYSDAEASFKTAIAKDKSYVRAYVSLGDVQARADRYNEAINSFQAALNIDATAKKAHRGLGLVYMDMKNYAKAIGMFTKATEVNAKDGLAWRGLGMANAEEGNRDAAATALEKATSVMRAKSRKADAYLRLGDIRLEQKQYDAAGAAYKSCLRFARKSRVKGGANYGLGFVSRGQGKRSEARKYFVQASKDNNWKRAADYEIDRIDNPHKYGE